MHLQTAWNRFHNFAPAFIFKFPPWHLPFVPGWAFSALQRTSTWDSVPSRTARASRPATLRLDRIPKRLRIPGTEQEVSRLHKIPQSYHHGPIKILWKSKSLKALKSFLNDSKVGFCSFAHCTRALFGGQETSPQSNVWQRTRRCTRSRDTPDIARMNWRSDAGDTPGRPEGSEEPKPPAGRTKWTPSAERLNSKGSSQISETMYVTDGSEGQTTQIHEHTVEYVIARNIPIPWCPSWPPSIVRPVRCTPPWMVRTLGPPCPRQWPPGRDLDGRCRIRSGSRRRGRSQGREWSRGRSRRNSPAWLKYCWINVKRVGRFFSEYN